MSEEYVNLEVHSSSYTKNMYNAAVKRVMRHTGQKPKGQLLGQVVSKQTCMFVFEENGEMDFFGWGAQPTEVARSWLQTYIQSLSLVVMPGMPICRVKENEATMEIVRGMDYKKQFGQFAFYREIPEDPIEFINRVTKENIEKVPLNKNK